MKKKLTPTGQNFRPQLGEPILDMAQDVLKRHPELRDLTNAVRFLCNLGWKKDTGKPAPEKALALIEGEKNG